MDKRGRPDKKRKREAKKSHTSHTGPGTDHKSPFRPSRTDRVEKSPLVKRPKLPKPSSRGRKGPVDQGLTESGEDEILAESDTEIASDAFSSTTKVFADLDIAPEIQTAIASMGFSNLKEIQRGSMPLILSQKDVIAISKPGSGKSLGALTASISLLVSGRFKPRNGTGIILLTPTRELAHQLFSITSELLSSSIQTNGIVTDGSNFRSEAEKIEKGINVLIATPRRLLEHLKKTTGFIIKDLKTLILDDSERLLDTETKDVIDQVIELLPKQKQTVLLTAIAIPDVVTETLHLKRPININVEGADKESQTAEGQVQGYVTIEADKRFLLLFSFVKKFQKKKVVVVLSSTAAAKAYGNILNAMGLSVVDVHGKQTAQKRAANISEFKEAEQGALLCTESIVQSLEVSCVDWLIQYDPPENPTRYISRLGHTATKAVIFLQPSESSFIDYLKEGNIKTEEFEFSNKQLAAVQGNLEKLISKNYALHCEAKDAFRSYLKNYTAHILPAIFDVSKLDLVKTAKAFGFDMPPRVETKVQEEKEEKWKMTYGPAKPGIGGVKKRKMGVR